MSNAEQDEKCPTCGGSRLVDDGHVSHSLWRPCPDCTGQRPAAEPQSAVSDDKLVTLIRHHTFMGELNEDSACDCYQHDTVRALRELQRLRAEREEWQAKEKK